MHLRLVDDKKVHWRSNLELIWMPRAQFGLIWEDIALDLDVFEIGGRQEELITTGLATSGSQN